MGRDETPCAYAPSPRLPSRPSATRAAFSPRLVAFSPSGHLRATAHEQSQIDVHDSCFQHAALFDHGSAEVRIWTCDGDGDGLGSLAQPYIILAVVSQFLCDVHDS